MSATAFSSVFFSSTFFRCTCIYYLLFFCKNSQSANISAEKELNCHVTNCVIISVYAADEAETVTVLLFYKQAARVAKHCCETIKRKRATVSAARSRYEAGMSRYPANYSEDKGPQGHTRLVCELNIKKLNIANGDCFTNIEA